MLIALFAKTEAQPQSDDLDHHYKGHKDATTQVQQLDSVIGFGWDNKLMNYYPFYVFIYKNNKYFKADTVIKLNFPARDYSNRQLNTYDNEGRITTYLYQTWTNGNWKDNMLTDYTYNAAGKLDTEIFSNLNSNLKWIPYQKHFYEYNDAGNISRYLRQNRNSVGEFYYFSQNIWAYNQNNLLTERVEQRFSDNVIFWRVYYVYNPDNTTERYVQNLLYDPVQKKMVMTNYNHQIYFSDIYGDPSYMENENWVNNQWVYTGRNIFYYSLIKGKKVKLCHNGHTIEVAAEAVKAHLEHGDKLGECKNNLNEVKGTGDYSDSDRGKKDSILIFPNPASDRFELKFVSSDHGYEKARLMTNTGQLINIKDIGSMESVTFDISGLKSGNFILKISGRNVPEKSFIILKKE
jgi:hypothetical protein